MDTEMTTWTGLGRFRSAAEGGRQSGPPRGPTYMATAVPDLGGETELLPGWPATGPQFSILVEFLGSPDENGWVRASVKALVEGAPGSEALCAGAELVVLEGPQEVARILIDRDEPSAA